MQALAVAVELSWGIVSGALAVFTAGGVGVGWMTFKTYQTYRKLEHNEGKRQAEAEKITAEQREKNLEQYRQMYELEKERSTRDTQDLRQQIQDLKKDLDYMRSRHRETEEECEKLRELNLKYQEDKRKDGHTIANQIKGGG